MLKNLNLPNKITMLRIFLVPIFVIFLCFVDTWDWTIWVALGLYIIASFTDFIDGYLSRKNNQVTQFGKIMDPLADKLLVSSGFIMLTGLGVIPAGITVVIIFRDFFVNALRMFGADKGSDLAAMLSGKIKTAFQLVGIILAMLDRALVTKYGFGSFITNAGTMDIVSLFINVFMTVTLTVAVVATLVSMIQYISRFAKDMEESTEESSKGDDKKSEKEEKIEEAITEVDETVEEVIDEVNENVEEIENKIEDEVEVVEIEELEDEEDETTQEEDASSKEEKE